MANKALTMLQTRRIIQLLMEGCSLREIHRSTGIHRLTVKNYLHRFQSSGQSFAELFSLPDHDLSVLVHPIRTAKSTDKRCSILNDQLPRLADELAKKGSSHVTKQVLWEEYLQQSPTGYQYSQFCYYLDQYTQQHDITMPSSVSRDTAFRLTLLETPSALSTRLPENVSNARFWSAPCPVAASFMLNRSLQDGRSI